MLFFVYIEYRTQEPLMPLSMLRINTLMGAILSAALFSASFRSLYYFLNMYNQEVLSYSPIVSGLIFLPVTLCAFFAVRLVNPLIS